MIRSAARIAPCTPLIVLLLGGVALGVRAAVAAPSASPDEVVVVVGDASPEFAFQRLIDAFGREGWRLKRVRGDGVAVFKHGQQWKGAVLVGPQGSVRVRRPVVHDAGLIFNVAAIGVHGQALPSKRKLRGPRARVLEGVDAELRGYRAAVSDRAAPAGDAVLLRALDALWRYGTPLRGGEQIPDLAGRRADALDYWASRTETDEGRASQQLVSRWLAEVVQRSAWPLTADEVEAAEARRGDGARVF
jgi:hypothetical protein